jgi:hypothetical protein
MIFAKNSKPGENEKGTKLENIDGCSSWREHQILNMIVVVY